MEATKQTKYTAQYFIDKFKAIPDEQWCTHNYTNEDGNHCAYGHCGVRGGIGTHESNGLDKLSLSIISINDGNQIAYSQPTPRGRVLAALLDLRDTTNKENNDDNDGS